MFKHKGCGGLARPNGRNGQCAVCVVALCVTLAGCSSTGATRMNFLPGFSSSGWLTPRLVHTERRRSARHAPQQSSGLRVGQPYVVAGRIYTPRFDPNYDRVGVASWYGGQFQGRATASGETFDTNRLSAAHPTLPLNTLVRVTNLTNDKSLIVRINDRGPFVDNRLIDLSRAAAERLGFAHHGLARVRVQVVRTASVD